MPDPFPAGLDPMRLRHSSLLALVSVSTLVADARARSFVSIEFEPCTLAPEFAAVSVEAQCGTLRVREDRSQPQGRQIELALAWVPTEHGTETDPVFMLA